MSTLSELVLRPNSAPRLASEMTLAEEIMFLLGRQATLGHEPPSDLRSTIAMRRPASAIVQAINLPAPPLPITRFSYFSMLDMGTPPLSVAKCMSVEVRYEL